MEMTTEEFLDRSSSWTLACDNALLNRLKSFSENLCKQSQGILEDCDSLSTEIDLLSCKVQTVTNQFLILSNTHFTENRVEEFQEMLTGTPNTQNTVPVKTKAEKEAELISKMKEAIQIGVAVKAERDHVRDNGHEPIQSDSIKLKLPHIIGTPKFFSSRYCGLLDEMKFQPTASQANDAVSTSASANPTDHPFEACVTEPKPESFNNDPEKVEKSSSSHQDLFFQTRELYRPPSISQSLYKEGSPSSADQFMHGTPSTASSSTSNLAQESDRKFGSDISCHLENKPNSLMAELNKSLHGRAPVPPSAVGNDSEDSEDDFRPPPPGKALKSTLFADEEDGDDDIFGDNSLFRSKQIGLENDDLFFGKPQPSASAHNLFSQNIRSTPVLFPSEPPPLEKANVQNSTPPTPDPTRTDSFDRLKTKSPKNPTANVSRKENEGYLFSDASSGVGAASKTIPPPILSSPGNKAPKHIDEALAKDDHPKPAFIIHKATGDGDDDHRRSPSVETGNTAEDEIKVPKAGTSFVKSMALGLKIDPAALIPSAKPPSRSTSILEDSTTIPVTRSYPDPVPQPEVLKPPTTPLVSSSRKTEVSAEPTTVPKVEDELTDDKLPVIAKPSFVKSMAAGLKINPAALMPGSKPRTPSQSKPPPSDEPEERQDTSDAEVESNAAVVISPPSPLLSPEPSTSPSTPLAEVGQNNSRSPTAPNPLPSPQPIKTASGPSVRPSSIFDDDSSEDDLFKPKPHRQSIRPAQKVSTTNSLFLSPQGSASGNSTKIAPAAASRSSVIPPTQSKDVTVSAVLKPPAEIRGTKPKTAIKKSIFDESDSDDELFGSKSINSNGKGNTSLFSDDEIFSSKPNTFRQEERGNWIGNEIKDEIKPEVVAVTPVPKTIQDLEALPVAEPAVGSGDHGLVETVSNPPDSPLFLNQPDLEDVDHEVPTVSPLRPKGLTTTRPPSIFKSGPTKKTTLKASTVKSIFDDSDSDDDLFKSSSSKSKTVPAKSQSAHVNASATLKAKLVFASNEEDDHGELLNKKQTEVPEDKGFKKYREEVTVKSSNSSTVPDDQVYQSEEASLTSNVTLNEAKGFVKHAARNLKINPLALQPGAKNMGPHTSKSTSTPPSSIDETDPISPVTIKQGVEVEKGVSFEDSLTSSNLLPSVAKSRPKIMSQNRRPPTRKPLIAKEEESEDVGIAPSFIVPPLTSDDDGESEEDLWGTVPF